MYKLQHFSQNKLKTYSRKNLNFPKQKDRKIMIKIWDVSDRKSLGTCHRSGLIFFLILQRIVASDSDYQLFINIFYSNHKSDAVWAKVMQPS